MNNDTNKPKQLVNFAKVIQVDKEGNPVQQNITTQEVKKETKKASKKDIVAVIGYIVLIIILLAVLGIYLYYYVMPRIK